MKNNSIPKIILVLVLLFTIGNNIIALPSRPAPPRLVNDFESLLSAQEVSALENKLVKYERTYSTQIAIVITRELGGYEIADYATQLGEKWGVGRAGSENGLLITVVPGDEQGRRLVYIAVGYGLEGAIPDITANRIVENEILPNFRMGNYYKGLDEGTNVLMQLAAGEFSANEYEEAQEEVPSGAVLLPFLFIFVIIFFLSRKRKAYSSPGKSIPFWTMFWLLTHGTRGSRGSYGNFSSGRGSFGRGGSFGGGGFKGFGGGRFGGGGAGGSW